MGGKFTRIAWKSGPRLLRRADLIDSGTPSGTIDRWLQNGRVHHAFNGVYAVGHPSLTREERWLAAVLACGEGAALSHLSAAALWEILPADGDEPDVSVPRTREGQQGIEVHRRRRPPRTTEHRGIPTTTIAQTLLDLAATFTQPHLERALGEAQLSPFFAEKELEHALTETTRGVTKLRTAWHVEHGEGVPKNVMERRFLRLVKQAGLRRPASNVPWGRWNIDALWLGENVAIELDGRDVHTRRAQFQRDREKDRELQLDGLKALRYTWADLTRRPATVTAECCRACASGPARAS
jgi:very-short-patch-repair endonuclease